MRKHLVSFLILFSVFRSIAQEPLEGCFQFGLLEIWNASGDSISATLKTKYECLYNKVVCFDSSINVVIISNGENGRFMRRLYDKRTNLIYTFRSDLTSKYVMIDSSMYLKAQYSKPSEYESTDSIKNIYGFQCRKYVSKDSGKAGQVKYEKYVAESIPEFPNSFRLENRIGTGLVLESLSLFPEPFPLRLRTGVIKLMEDFEKTMLSTDIRDYQLISDREWGNIFLNKE